MTRITAVFDSQAQAEAAVTELRRMGINDAHLSFIGRHGDVRTGDFNNDTTATANNTTNTRAEADARDTASDTGKGLLAGATVGALFGLAAAVIPGVGPFITAGALASSLGAAGGGAVAGAIVGGGAGALAGALSNAGYSRDEAEYYGNAVDRGGTLVAIDAGYGVTDSAILDVLQRHGGHLYNR